MSSIAFCQTCWGWYDPNTHPRDPIHMQPICCYCNLCGKGFTSKNAYDGHSSHTYCDLPEFEDLYCQNCDIEFKKARKYNKHIRQCPRAPAVRRGIRRVEIGYVPTVPDSPGVGQTELYENSDTVTGAWDEEYAPWYDNPDTISGAWDEEYAAEYHNTAPGMTNTQAFTIPPAPILFDHTLSRISTLPTLNETSSTKTTTPPHVVTTTTSAGQKYNPGKSKPKSKGATKYYKGPQKQKTFYPAEMFGKRRASGILEVHEIAQMTNPKGGKKASRPCPLCGKEFATAHRLKDHLEGATHAGDAVLGSDRKPKLSGKGKGKSDANANVNARKSDSAVDRVAADLGTLGFANIGP